MKLPTLVTAGIYDSRIAAKSLAISQNRRTTKFELELPIEGGGTSYIDSNTTPIHPNMIISVKPGQLRHTKFPFKCYYVHMTLPEGPLRDTLLQTENYIPTERRETYERLFARLIKHVSFPSPTEEILVQSLLLELIYTVIKDSSAGSLGRTARRDSAAEEGIRYIREHLTEDLSLETVARAVSLSPVYFHNVFKAATGKTLHSYIEEQRIKKAIHLLQTTDASLTGIAYECGFSSQSYFSFVFKRRMGQTPRSYLRESYGKYEQ
ncbi:MAG: helix-turn-helix transcriptional regulator [Clostridia bacterium]|nr:helix-turn-helix transcriptional regulator [Clostridia bacterium]